MALPVKQLNWNFDVNVASFGASATEHAQTSMFAAKNALCTLGANPWQVVMSCDASTFGAGDRWTDWQHTVWGGTAASHGWIVMNNPAQGPGQFCIELASNAGVGIVTMYYSPGGLFAGGALNAAPAAADRITILGYSYWGGPSGANQTRIHTLHSDDGKSSRVFFCRSGVAVGMWDLSGVANPNPASWTEKQYAMIVGDQGTNPVVTIGNLMAANMWGRISGTPVAGGNVQFGMTTLGVTTGSIMNVDLAGVDQITGEWQATPAGIYCKTVSYKGYRGDCWDLWLGSTGMTNGMAFPDDASRQFAAFGQAIVPWNGSVPQTS